MTIEINGEWLKLAINFWDIQSLTEIEKNKLKRIIKEVEIKDKTLWWGENPVCVYDTYWKFVVKKNKVLENGDTHTIYYFDLYFEYRTKTGILKKSKIYPCYTDLTIWNIWWKNKIVNEEN